MIETLVQLDKEVMLFLNNLGEQTFDPFWLFITKQLNWLPFFLLIFYFLLKKVGLKAVAVVVVVLTLLILCTDQLTNLVKHSVGRQRPCNTEDIRESLRIVKCSTSLSFFSGHASNSMATMLFMYILLRRYYRYAFLVFIFPLVFAYSRIYLSLHFPSDILVGYMAGLCTGGLFYRFFVFIERKYQLN